MRWYYIVELYPSNSHKEGFEILQKECEKHLNKKVPTGDIKMTEFVLKTNLFEFRPKSYKKISRTAVGTKFDPPYDCNFMNYFTPEFFKMQDRKLGCRINLLMILPLFRQIVNKTGKSFIDLNNF